jgi:chromosome segregation ATPase
MSEPLRFKPVNPAHEMIYSADGGWVSWEDYAPLKAEVERLTAFTTRTIIPNEELQKQVEELELEVFAFDRTIKQASCHYDNRLEDIRQLQAQVERLTKASQGAVKYVDHTMALTRQSMEHHKQVSRLEAQVERLTKAGDALTEQLEGLGFDSVWDFWNAAKEGNPHA